MAETRVFAVATASRVVVSLLAWMTSAVVKPYDTSAYSGSGKMPLASFANWDGVYFMTIAEHGYPYEEMHAFFPFYPMLMRAMSALLPFTTTTGVIVSGWFISNMSFVVAAVYLYRLTNLLFQDPNFSLAAVLLFCINPATIFMSAVYTESLMTCLSFTGFYYLERHRQSSKYSDLLRCSALFGLAAATRSNGNLLSLFVAYRCLQTTPSLAPMSKFLTHWMSTAFLGLLCLVPQFVYFAYSAYIYCPSLSSSEADDRPWCASLFPNPSAMYMFIQKEYWGVGLFSYYTLQQLPNFLLASPILIFSAYSLTTCLKGYKRELLPYYSHWLFLTTNAVLVVHIQVTTRLLSACPALYWSAAAIPMDSAKGKTLLSYFLLYNILGTSLFSAFYPWT